ncbi:sigma factor [Prevotella sp.]|uniref:sigma factor n=1 Tax=Prevotella sp. TaxID=59823 RepID=UPI00307BF2B6
MNDFERLFNRLYPRVKLFAMQLLKHEDEAEDVAQNVFAKLWEMPEKWSEDNLDSYVFVMTRNHVLNVIRYRKIHEIGGESVTTTQTQPCHPNWVPTIRCITKRHCC